jgi:hypothetical protein
MPNKRQSARTIDLQPAVKFGVVQEETTTSLAPPAQVEIAAPTGLTLTTSSGSSTAAPTAVISATWTAPPGYTPDYYAVEVDESNAFPAATTRKYTTAGSQPSIAIPNLKPATTYYVHVAAKRAGRQSPWTSMSPLVNFQNYILSDSDTTPSAQPTGLTGTWIGTGDLLLTWVNPPSANYKELEITIKASSGGTTYRVVNWRSSPFLYTAAMNLADTSGAGDPSLYVEVRSRTFSNVVNNASVPTVTTTKSAPSAPTVTHSWSGDTGIAGADLTLNWTAMSDAAYYSLALNGGTARRIGGTTYTYPLDRNIADNTTADPTIGYSLIAVDGLGQSSTAATGTATNAAPPAPTVTVYGSAIGTFAIAKVGGTQAADFAKYEYVWRRDGATVGTARETPDSENIYEMSAAADSGPHDWTCTVRQKDAFAQYSSATASAAVQIDALTLAVLRADITYRDSEGTDPNTLKAALSDGVTTTGGITYGP